MDEAKRLFFVGLVQTVIVLWASIDLLIHRDGFGLIALILAAHNAKVTSADWDKWRNQEVPVANL